MKKKKQNLVGSYDGYEKDTMRLQAEQEAMSNGLYNAPEIPRKGFIQVYWGILENRELSSTDKLLYGVLLSFSKMKGYAYPKNETLGKRFGLSNSSISNSLANLKKEGLISVNRPRGPFRRIHVIKPNSEKNVAFFQNRIADFN